MQQMQIDFVSAMAATWQARLEEVSIGSKRTNPWIFAVLVWMLGTLGSAQSAEIATTGVNGVGQSQPAGLYKTPSKFSLPFSFETKQPFDARFERLGRAEIFGLTRGQSPSTNATHWMLMFLLPKGISVAEATEALKATRSVSFGDGGQSIIGTAAATYFDATAKTDQASTPGVPAGTVAIPAIGELLRQPALEWFTESPQASLRFVVLEYKERTLLIYIETPKGDFESFTTELEQVLASIRFIDP